jgi:hypothetical protein
MWKISTRKTSNMKSLPLSICLFAITGILFLLQLFPYTGIFLMMLGAMGWSTILINLGFIVMIIESLYRKLPRWFILFPIIYFGGYAALTIASHTEFYLLQRDATIKNQSANIPFNSEIHALVIGKTDSMLSGMANWMVQSYDIPVIYDKNPNFHTANHLSYRLAGKFICDKARKNFTVNTGIFTNPVYENGKMSKDLCAIRKPEDPTLPIYTLTTTESSRYKAKTTDFLLPTYDITITITDPIGHEYKLYGGTAEPFRWLPMPVIGCWLNSGAAKWECDATFMRERFSPIARNHNGETGDISMIADALHLKRSPASARIDSSANDPVTEKQIENINNEALENELALLHSLINDSGYSKYSESSFPILLYKRSDLLASEALGMVQALKRFTQNKSGNRESRNTLAKLISRLPQKEFLSQAHELIEIVRQEPDIKEMPGYKLENDAEDFIIRLGDAGPEAYDILLNMMNKNIETTPKSWTNYWVALAICRAGSDIGEKVKPSLIKILNSTDRYREQDLHSAAYVALLRLGFKNDALKDPSAGTKYGSSWYDNKLATVTPESPKSVCTTIKKSQAIPLPE